MTEKLDGLKRRILANTFVDGVRIRARVDEQAFEELSTSLRELATALAGVPTVDKELALVLYCIPMMVRNAFLTFDDTKPRTEFAQRLEDAWVDLDALVTACLAD